MTKIYAPAAKAFGNLPLSQLDMFMEALAAQQEKTGAVGAYRTIGIVRRCVAIRMNGAAAVPFSLYRGDDEVSTSTNWNDPTGGLPLPHRSISQIEGALSIYGVAYLSKNINDILYPGLRYLLPSSIKFNDVVGKRVTFTRTISSTQRKPATDKDLVFIWGEDPTVEVGPPLTSPLKAALAAAGVVESFDEFMERFADCGMVKTTLLAVPAGTAESERERIDNVFKRLLTGVRRAFSIKTIEADNIKPTVVGSGLEDLGDGILLTAQEQRVARDMGVPMSILFANAANFATAQQDDRNFYDKTIVPDIIRVIFPALNHQWYEPRGYRLVSNFHALDAYQEDETQRAQAYSTYVNTGMKQSIAAEMLGLELPPGIEYADLDGEQEEPEQEQADDAPSDDDAETQEAMNDLKRWQRVALKRYKEGRPEKAVDFLSDCIPPWLCESIVHAFEHCKDAQDIRIVFGLAAKAVMIGGDGQDENAPDRDAYEVELEQQVSSIVGGYYDAASDYVAGGDTPPDYAELRAALFAVLIAHYTRVATDRLEGLEAELQLDVDDGAAAAEISSWANAQANERADQLTGTTRDVVERARASFVAGMTAEEIEQLLRGAFGDPRYEAIAISETTTGLSNGARVYQALLAAMGIISLRTWITQRDERVCPICGPLHEKKVSVWGDQFPFGPPAHPRCRCYETLLVR